MTPSILVLAAIVALAASAYRALAPGAEKIPMQWSLRQGELVGAPAHGLRLRAGTCPRHIHPADRKRQAGGNDIAFTGCILFGCPIVHIALVCRWFAARQA
ncbi:hypothetical protein AJ87_15635 [Rhizobium yanglingense]|nr:hypothetical protein AJ87_15635 [Rhizobium yanglingense]